MKTYQYTITLKREIWPRKLADVLENTELREALVSVKDLQKDTHMYGDTYVIGKANTSKPKSRSGRSSTTYTTEEVAHMVAGYTRSLDKIPDGIHFIILTYVAASFFPAAVNKRVDELLADLYDKYEKEEEEHIKES
jgi:hypothetical protein